MSDITLCQDLNTNSGSKNSCTGEIEYLDYGYNVRTWTAALFVAFFGLSALFHLVQGIRCKRWYLLGTVFLCAVTETIGWSGRLWSAVSTEWHAEFGGYWYSNDDAFMMQIATLIIAPAFLAAAWYWMLGHIIKDFGPQYCRFNPRTYSIVFVTGDITSLVIQALGGGIASGADDLEGANTGARIMVGGVFFQMAVMLVFAIVYVDFVWHFFKRKPVKPLRLRRTRTVYPFIPYEHMSTDVYRKVKLFLAAIAFSWTAVLCRSFYRDVELLDGWHGKVIETQTYFDILDALMIILATATFNFIHPTFFWPKHHELPQQIEMGSQEMLDSKASSRSTLDRHVGQSVSAV